MGLGWAKRPTQSGSTRGRRALHKQERRPRRGASVQPAGRLAVRAAADRLEALRAVDGLVAARLEGDAGLLAARRAGRREHLAARAIVAAATTIAAAAAVARAAGRVGVAAAL